MVADQVRQSEGVSAKKALDVDELFGNETQSDFSSKAVSEFLTSRLQDLRGEGQTLRGENQTLRGENRTLRGEKQTLRGEGQTFGGENKTLLASAAGEMIDLRQLGDIYARATSTSGRDVTKQSELSKTGDATIVKAVDVTDPASAARETLLRSADQHIRNPHQRAKFKADVAAFDKRATADKIDSGDVAKTFESVNRILTAQSSAVPKDRMPQVAREVMRQVANPTSIDQGTNNTCSVSTIENILYSTQPALAAKLVADVATTGRYTAADGTKIELDKNSLKPDPEASKVSTADGDRSFASQLFNVTAVNAHYAKEQPNLRYEVHPANGKDRGGERIVDYSKTPPQRVRNECGGFVREPNLEDDSIVGIYKSLSGRDGKDIFLSHADSTTGDTKDVTLFSSFKEFGDKIQELKDAGKLPIILGVNTAIEPLWTESGGGSMKGYQGGHVLVLRDFKPGPPARVSVDKQGAGKMQGGKQASGVQTEGDKAKNEKTTGVKAQGDKSNPSKVSLDNQYGSENDHLGSRSMTLRDAYLLTLNTDKAIEFLQQEIRDERRRGVRDAAKARELNRLKKFIPGDGCR